VKRKLSRQPSYRPPNGDRRCQPPQHVTEQSRDDEADAEGNVGTVQRGRTGPSMTQVFTNGTIAAKAVRDATNG